MSPKIGLIDYGMGNLYSVQQAFKRLNHPINIVRKPVDLKSCDALILPGVGAFDPAMTNLAKTDLIPDLKAWVNDGKALLGICLGLQLLFESSDEGTMKGLGLLKGHIHRLPNQKDQRIPNMGWSPLDNIQKCPLFENNQIKKWMYFVHSYSAIPSNQKDLVATTPFGRIQVTAAVWHKNTGACQFHPEKSGKAGQELLFLWMEWLQNKANFSD